MEQTLVKGQKQHVSAAAATSSFALVVTISFQSAASDEETLCLLASNKGFCLSQKNEHQHKF